MAATTCQAWTVSEKGKPAELSPLELNALAPTEVRVKVRYCGVCASDIGILTGGAPGYQFPMVAGHEGAGEVVECGSSVKNRKVGDRVGLGIYRYSCGDCGRCASGKDNLCKDKALMFQRGASGAFGEMVVIDERYAVPVPDAIPLEYVGPLMCAGQTVFAPFMEHNIRPGQRVGVVGIGGLGHLALQFSKAMGCITTAFSRNDSKKAEAEGFGAAHFVATGDPEQVKAAAGSLDFILMTAGGPGINWDELFSFLDTGGMIIIMGFTGMDPIPVNPMVAIMGQKGLKGSAGGSLHVCRSMLQLAAASGVRPMIELMPAAEINEAVNKVKSGTVRYRAVLQFD